MIEITGPRGRKDEQEKITKKGKLAAVKHSGKTFSSELQKTLADEFEGPIDKLMQDLKDQEKRFLDKQSEHEMSRYKALVQKILKSILDEEGVHERTLKRKKKNWGDFIVIDRINEKLLELTNAITKQNKAFDLLKTMEEIRGLILDLVY